MQGVKIAMHSTHHLDWRESKQTFLLISPGCLNTGQRHLAIYGRCRCVGSKCRGEIAPVRCLCRSRSGWAHVHRLDPKNDGTYMWQCAPNLRRCCTPTQRMMAGGKNWRLSHQPAHWIHGSVCEDAMYAQGCFAMWNNSLLAAHALPCSVYRQCSCRLWRSSSVCLHVCVFVSVCVMLRFSVTACYISILYILL